MNYVSLAILVQSQINLDNLLCVWYNAKKKLPFDLTGGVRQRAKRAKGQSEEVAAPQVESEECDNVRPDLDSEAIFHWPRKWSWGKISAAEVQREALRSHNDFQRTLSSIPLSEDFMPKSLMRVAQLGHWGTHPGNVHRELKYWLGETTIPAAHVITVPMAITKPTCGAETSVDVDFPILFPHEILAHVYRNQPALFKQLYIAGDMEEQTLGMHHENFWSTVQERGDPRLLNHPMTTIRDWKQTFVPLSLHGDGVPVTKIGKAGSKSMEVYSFSGLLGMGSTRATKVFSFGMFESSKIKENDASMAQIWKTILWSLTYASQGIFPTHDVECRPLDDATSGQPLAGG